MGDSDANCGNIRLQTNQGIPEPQNPNPSPSPYLCRAWALGLTRARGKQQEHACCGAGRGAFQKTNSFQAVRQGFGVIVLMRLVAFFGNISHSHCL